MAMGSSIDFGRQHGASIAQPALQVVQDINQPFDSPNPSRAVTAFVKMGNLIRNVLFAAWLFGFLAILAFYAAKGRSIKTAARKAAPITEGRAFEALQRLRPISVCRLRIRLASTGSSMEPGVFGIFRPVLLLPQGMADRLSDSELEAILAHELAHVRHRDNLIAAVHMFIEALFWFHPMVWWLGAKLVQERERACDEDVLRLGKDPQAYAEGILKVCEFYLESPLACVAGITGSDMKKLIHAIMTCRIGGKLGPMKKLLLAGAAIAALSFPLSIGLLSARLGRAQAQQVQDSPKPSFEVVSIKIAENCGNVAPGVRAKIPGKTSYDPGGHYSTCSQLAYIIRDAYQIEAFSPLTGVPGWSNDVLYKIEAKAEGNPDKSQMRLMVQSLIEDRFKLKIHQEKEEAPVYSLVVAKGSTKLQPAKNKQGDLITSLPPSDTKREEKIAELRSRTFTPSEMEDAMGPGYVSIAMKPSGFEFRGRAISMKIFADALSSNVRRKVLDKTGITGLYDIEMVFANPFSQQATSGAAGTEISAPTIFNALQEQLGLKLESKKAPMDHFTIDSVEKPSEN